MENKTKEKVSTWNIKGKPRISVNEDFFEIIDSELKAYWLGFLFADGCVHKHDRVEVQLKDLDHMEKYAKAIQYKGEIRHYLYGENSFNPGGDKYRIIFTSKKMCDDLKSKGCVSGKSKKMELPKDVPSELMRHFIRGYVDGDGSVYIRSRDGLGMSISGPKHFLEFLREKIPFPTHLSHDKGQTYSLQSGALPALWLYEDSASFMTRKKEIVID